MRYDEFRTQLRDALRKVGLDQPDNIPPSDQIDVSTTDRRWTMRSHCPASRAEPFHVSANVSFRWNPFQSARSYTREEDLLAELRGTHATRRTRTHPRFIRVDFELFATLPYDSIAPIPTSAILRPWTRALEERLEPFLPSEDLAPGRSLDVRGGRMPLEVDARTARDGSLSLSALRLRSFRMVKVPRIWDDPESREREKGIERELETLTRRFRDALGAWVDSARDLVPSLRYMPPPGEPARPAPGD